MAITHRCEVCKKTPNDYDREGIERSKWDKELMGWGTPAVKKRIGAWICDFCLERLVDLYNDEKKPRFLAAPDKKRPTITPEQRWAVWERDDYTCRRCGARKHLSVDHIVPLCLNGEHHESNMQTLCGRCNRSKGGRLVKIQ